MLKHLIAPVLGLVVLVGAVAPAAADRGRSYSVKPTPQYPYARQSAKKATGPNKSQQQRFNRSLDFETEAVWRNLRPSLFIY
jgi:hypothetical protein